MQLKPSQPVAEGWEWPGNPDRGGCPGSDKKTRRAHMMQWTICVYSPLFLAGTSLTSSAPRASTSQS
eukprot:126331-Rhodomonas_salina.1